jgi:hypothetical protein
MNSILSTDDDARFFFYEQANRYINSLNINFREKAVITRSTNEKIMRCLQKKTLDEFNSRFISWCRNSFALRFIETHQFLCNNINGKPVLIYEDMYDAYNNIHIETAHSGREKCLDSITVNYSWFNRHLLQIFLKNCAPCGKRKSIEKPIIALGF